MANSMKGKIALVTGSSSGIGRATALVFAQAGAVVVGCANLNTAGGEETVRMIGEAGGESIFIQTDVTKEEHVARLIEQIIDSYGRLDYACNNAGGSGLRVPLTQLPEAEWSRLIDLNMKSAWFCMKYEIPEMLKQGSGAIVNLSSDAGLKAMPLSGAYSAAKHGIIGLSKAAAVEFAEKGVRVNCVCPGPTRTPILEELCRREPGREAFYLSIVPLKRIALPMEIAEAIVWLCSDSASYVTGHALPVDGGSAELM
jgi:NAD(P)-dependent dehydrogenase (short-subunit alcohol dehydrogenase family)